jgi:c(7)-type cytochrome triheme protein
MQCGWCHDETFEMEALAMEAERDFNMGSLCNETYCGTCHNGDISFSTTTQCARCHIGQKGYDRLVKEGKIEPEESDGEVDTTDKKNGEKPFPKFDVVKTGQQENKDTAFDKMVEAEYFPEEITLEDFKPENSSIFSHEKHLSREKLSCMRCHPDIFIMKVGDKAVKKGQLTMEQMKKGKYCGTCHNGEDAFSISEKEFCGRCHPGQ